MTKRDLDVETMTLVAAKDEVMKLRAAIRVHMNMRGDDRCCGDDHELYETLPEGDTRPEKDSAVTIENCALFIKCRQNGERYVSPQRYIEELEAQVKDYEMHLGEITTVGLATRLDEELKLAQQRIKDLEAELGAARNK
jgi:hypothetical protein